MAVTHGKGRVLSTSSGTATVSGTITANQGTANTSANRWPVYITDGTNNASVRDTGSNDALNVAIVDASGNQITSFGGGTTTVIQPTAASLKARVFQPTAASLLARVSSPTSASLLARVFQPTAASLLVRPVQVTAASLLARVSQPTSASLLARVFQPTAASLLVRPVQTTAASLLVRAVQSTAASFRTTSNQGNPAGTASRWPVQISDGTDLALVTTPNTDNITGANMTGVNVVSANYYLDGSTWDAARGDSTSGAWIQGAVAHDDADAGNPNKQGFQARSTNATLVANIDRVNGIADLGGRQVVVLGAPRQLKTRARVSMTSTAAATLFAAGGTGVFNQLISLKLTNTSQTGTVIDIRDNSTGTIRISQYLVPGGSSNDHFAHPWGQTAANSLWTVKLRTAVASVIVSAQVLQEL